MFHTEIQVQLAGLLGVGLQIQKSHNWGCPFEDCEIEFDKYSQIIEHVVKDHSEVEATLYSRVGGFWAPLLWHLHKTGRWPRVGDFFTSTRQARVELIRMSREEAEAVWRPRVEFKPPEVLSYRRPTEVSPLDDLLIKRRDIASAPQSVEASDVGEDVRPPEVIEVTDEDTGTEADTSEVIEALFKSLAIRNRSQEQRQPLMPRMSQDETIPEAREQLEQPLDLAEQEDEPDTEYEEVHHVEESMNLHHDVDPIILIRMQRLKEILRRGSEATEDSRGRELKFQRGMTEEEERQALANDLEALLEEFQREEISPERFAEVTLEDPILLLLAQHRSFRICRSEFFCPEEGCRPHKPITSLGRLATHLQTFHGVTKEETSDMVRYFITKLLPGPVQAIITTSKGNKVKGERCLCRCHSPGCSYTVGLKRW
jgi:hypothetical protein